MRRTSTWPYIARDLSDEGKEAGYLPTLRAVRGNGFPDEVARIEELLADPDQYAVIADEVSTFYAAYEADRKLMRFRLPYITECAVAVEEYAMPRRDYDSQMIEVPAVGRFITDDEVDSVIEGGQGSYSGAALRIYQFFQEKHTDAERADFLKHTYGIGGRMPGVHRVKHRKCGRKCCFCRVYLFADHSSLFTVSSSADCVIYEEYVAGVIDAETFQKNKASLDVTLLRARNTYAAMKAKVEEKQTIQDRHQQRQQLLDDLQTEGALTNELAERIIDHIIIHPDRRIEIVYKIADLLE